MITQNVKGITFVWRGIHHRIVTWQSIHSKEWGWAAAKQSGYAATEEQAMTDARNWIKYGRLPKTQ